MRVLRFLTLGFFPLFAFAQTPAQDWRFAQPGATLAGSVRVDALLRSPILNMVISQAAAKDPTVAAMTSVLHAAMGDVTEVRFSICDAGPGKDLDVLALVIGRIDDAAAAALAQGKATVYRVDENTLLLGSGDSLAASIQRLEQPQTASRALLRGKALQDYDLWIAGALPAVPMTAALGGLLNGIALGMSLNDDLHGELALDTASAEMAEELIRQARAAHLPATLLTDVDDTTARFHFSVDKNVMVQAIQQASAMAPVPKFKEQPEPLPPVTAHPVATN